MNKYRVLKTYPKQITNSGRLLSLRPGSHVYLKKEPQVLRLVRMGYLKPIIELPNKVKVKKPKVKVETRREAQVEAKETAPERKRYRKDKKSENLNKKNVEREDVESNQS